ncbi:MAG: hypothetical protein RL227_2551 [Pseudomonadota bacterium]|jgi:hypothetical protein
MKPQTSSATVRRTCARRPAAPALRPGRPRHAWPLALGALLLPACALAQGGPAPEGSPREHRGVENVPQIFEQPGVLTPRGGLVIEPSMQYAYSSSNRIALVGYTVIPALLIGVIDVREVKRNTYTATMTARYGLTNRLELEARVPAVYRQDTSIGRRLLGNPPLQDSVVFDASGKDLGDVEATLRYQLNDGGADRPYFVGSLRLKSRTGRDPFQVETTTVAGLGDGVQTTLPTGSGFVGVQPALTMLMAADPAVFFGSVSMLYSVKRTDVTRQTPQGPQVIPGTIQPGHIYGFNFGMGMAINERASFSIGYDHSSVGKTRQNGVAAPDTVRVQLGTLLLGLSFKPTPKRTLSLTLGAGVTRDTPDVTLTLRVPMSL